MPRTVWYPGHMARGGRKLAELADKLDLIIEVRDARAPFSTSAPLVTSLLRSSRNCSLFRVLTKKDLADPERTHIWLEYLTRNGSEAWAMDLRKRDGLAPLRRALAARKPTHRELRLAVMGIPNVGKSMLLNALVGKAQAQVGGIPGVTRSVNWYHTSTTGRGNSSSASNADLLVVDSPGILDPHAEPGVHLVLSWLGCAKAEVVGGFESAALLFIRFLHERNLFATVLRKWLIAPSEGGEIHASVLDETPHETLERIGQRLGCLMSGGTVNTELAARRLIESFASGKLGPVTLELPGDPIFTSSEFGVRSENNREQNL